MAGTAALCFLSGGAGSRNGDFAEALKESAALAVWNSNRVVPAREPRGPSEHPHAFPAAGEAAYLASSGLKILLKRQC